MLIYIHIFNIDGQDMDIKTTVFKFSNKSQDFERLTTLPDLQKPTDCWYWIDLFGEYEALDEFIANNIELDIYTRQVLTAEDTRPRCISHEQDLLVNLRGANLNPGTEPEDMLSIRMLIRSNVIITIHRQKVLSIEKQINSIESKQKIPSSPIGLFISLCDYLSKYIAEIVEDVEECVDNLEEEILTATSRELMSTISESRRRAIMLKRHLSPQKETLYRLQFDAEALLTKTQQFRLREINDRTTRLLEDLDATRDRAVIMMEEFLNRLSEQMNNRMYVLSVVAALFLPLSFVTGLLGINVGGIPGTNNPHGFAIVSAILLVFGILMILAFKKSKWI